MQIRPVLSRWRDHKNKLRKLLDSAVKEYDTPEKKKERDAMIKAFLAKGGKVEKVPAGIPRKGQMSRDDLLGTNLKIIKQVAEGICMIN